MRTDKTHQIAHIFLGQSQSPVPAEAGRVICSPGAGATLDMATDEVTYPSLRLD